jgi:hypothetical protein
MANELSCYEQAARKAKAPADHLAPALVPDGDPPALSMSGEDFYRAACVEAHARLLNLP